jgi:hypothetical protein
MRRRLQVGQPCVANLKVSFTIPDTVDAIGRIAAIDEYVAVRRVGNIWTLKTGAYCYLFFKRGNVCTRIGATGIRGYVDIEDCLWEFCCLFSISRQNIADFRVDNITASASTDKPFGADAFRRFLLLPSHLTPGLTRVHYNLQAFPGACFQFKGWGTCIVFQTGSLSFVGSRRVGHLQLMRNGILKRLQALCQQHPV